MDKCPKCDEMECDCVVSDEDNGPMLVMKEPTTNIQRPSESLSQYDNVNNEAQNK